MDQKHRELEQRVFDFVVRVVKLGAALPRNRMGEVISNQMLRSVTSIGANLNEAQSASSKREFTYKLSISEGEARETLYWLRLVVALELVPSTKLDTLTQENNEIIAILTTIGRNARRTSSE